MEQEVLKWANFTLRRLLFLHPLFCHDPEVEEIDYSAFGYIL